MEDKKIPIITISREFCAGGSSVAKGISEKLNIPWYDRDFVALTARLSGYSEEDIIKDGENLSYGMKFLNSIANNITAYTSSHDKIFEAQKEAIAELSKQPCIIVGRCSNVVLKEMGVDSFDIFLHADFDIRVERSKDVVKNTKKDLRKYVEKADEMREKHYYEYTHKKMTLARDYDLCLDTGKIDYDTCVEAACVLIKKRFEL